LHGDTTFGSRRSFSNRDDDVDLEDLNDDDGDDVVARDACDFLILANDDDDDGDELAIGSSIFLMCLHV
tara:strand:- start:92 stop:298 length:207 start_codon:yes stop_codon:yes gene_type:complete